MQSMNTIASRQPAGTPVGGQFASHDRPEAHATLTAQAGTLSWPEARAKALAVSSRLDDGMHEDRARWLLRVSPAEAAQRMREAADTAAASLAAEQLKSESDYDPEWAETYRKMADGHLAMAQKLELAAESDEFAGLGARP